MSDPYRKCRRCAYFSPSTNTCDYILDVGKPRPSPPGDACTAMKPKTKTRKKALTVS